MDDITRALDGLTSRIIAERYLLRTERQMGRLEEKLARVAGVAQRVTEHVETRADRVLDREPQLVARSEHIFAAKNALLDDAEKALDRVERAMGLLTNDPFQGSGRSPQGQPALVCESCGGKDFDSFAEAGATGIRNGRRCTGCSKIVWDAA